MSKSAQPADAQVGHSLPAPPLLAPIILRHEPFTEERMAKAEPDVGAPTRLRRWWQRLTRAWRTRPVDPVLEDWRSARRLEEAGQLVAYLGQFVAVLGGQVVGYGPHPGELRDAVAQIAQTDPHRVVIMAVDAGEIGRCSGSFAGSQPAIPNDLSPQPPRLGFE